MKSIVYSHWDGSQAEFRLDAEEALDALSDLLMEGLDVQQALEWMRRYGFQLGGLDMRVMGLDEMLDEQPGFSSERTTLKYSSTR